MRFVVLALAVGGVLIGLCIPACAIATLPLAPAAPFTVALTGQPTAGVVPLLVTFHAAPNLGIATSFYWTFGDGTTFNGSAGDSSPTHRYDRPGTFTATVVVAEGNETATGTLLVRALSGPLRASIAAVPLTGTAPLTVHFTANLSGGTETYISVVWSFGTGDVGSGLNVTYTYSSPGRFLSQVRVTDTGEGTATSFSWVDVTAASDVARATWVSNLSSPFALSALAISFVAAAAVVYRFLTRTRTGAPKEVVGPVAADVATAGSISPPPSEPPPAETLRVSERVLVHLLREGRVGSSEVAPPAISQAGIGGALGVSQNALTHVLTRLMAGGLLSAEPRHVAGRGRRLKTYQLTPRGEQLARRLWYRILPGAPPGSTETSSSTPRSSPPERYRP